MVRLLTGVVMLLFSSLTGWAQSGSIKGILTDEADNKPVRGATISLLRQADSLLVNTTISDAAGYFVFTAPSSDSFILTVNTVNYRQHVFFFVMKQKEINMGTIVLARQGKDLANVTIIAKTPPVSQSGDTTQYNASQYKVNPDANAEDLIKKMPGITVDKAGTVTAQGEQVKKVTVDGKDFFGDDATATLKNLPAEIIDKIQVFDRLSDQAQFTGFDDGNSTKAINIITKSGSRNGQFGRIYAGYGTDDRYTAGGNVSFFKGDRRLSFVGLFNNINQQNFATEDLLGVTSSGGGRQGGSNRGAANRGGGNSGNFLVGQQNGISATNATGVNYSDRWSKKLEVTGSYFFNNSITNNNQLTNDEYFIRDAANQFYDETNLSTANNYNHRLNLRMEFKIDSFNAFTFTPSFSFQKNNADKMVNGTRYYTLSDLVSSTGYSTSNKVAGFTTANNLLYRHAFAKKGRTISVNAAIGGNHRDAGVFLESVNQYFNSSNSNDSILQHSAQLVNGNNYSGNIVFTEPIGKKGQLQFNYSTSVTYNRSNQEVNQFDVINSKYTLFDSSLSNRFNNTVKTNTTGTSYRAGNRDNMFSIGFSYKHTALNSERLFPAREPVHKTFSNLLPNVSWRKKLSVKSSVNIMYRANTNTPSINQLQQVINNTNSLFLTTGNPDLKQQTTNILTGRYTYTNTVKGTSFFANVYVQQANNYITNASLIARKDSVLYNDIILYKGSQLTRPVNVNGYVSLRSFLTFGTPIKFIKSNFNINGGVTWTKIPGIVNETKSITNNYVYSIGAVISSNISEYIDFNLSYNAGFNVSNNSLQLQLNNHFTIQNAGLQWNLLSKKGWFLQNDISYQSYSGLSAGFNQRYWLWNAGVGKKFLKKQAGELKLSVFDLLKQNRSISRTITESYIEDVQNQVLTRFFMLTFSYKLKNFGVPKAGNKMRSGRQGGAPDM